MFPRTAVKFHWDSGSGVLLPAGSRQPVTLPKLPLEGKEGSEAQTVEALRLKVIPRVPEEVVLFLYLK